MNRVTFLVLVSLFATGAAVSVSPGGGEATLSPGPVHGDHANATCGDCHSAWRGVTDESCLGCHEGVDTPGNESYVLHGNFTENCVACHDDHDGANASLTFAVDHDPLTGDCGDCHGPEVRRAFPAGDHWSEGCGDCHGTDSWVVEEFDHSDSTYGCTACHLDDLEREFRPGQHWNESCDTCHGTEDWDRITLDHGDFFPLTGDHRIDDCNECHPGGDLKTWSCYSDCHEEHTEPAIAREHEEEGISDYDKCLECHPTGREHEFGGFEGEDD